MDRMKEQFRKAMRNLIYPVSIASSAINCKKYAITVSSVTSLTLNPPSILVCINKESSFSRCISVGNLLNINFLSYNQIHMAELCSRKESVADRFNVCDWSIDSNGLPYLKESESILFCNIVKSVIYETHLLALLKVNVVQLKSELKANPLLYGHGEYIRV